ncbi:MAG: molecular chaperone TorD family protein [Deltaproteobacteria bacterium]|nr:molecular chaperone TorD family protein [Deltaproteobacteria bacterium]
MNPDFEKMNAPLETAYRLLSACLYQPSPEWLEENVFGNLEQVLSVVAPTVAHKAGTMAEALGDQGEAELTTAYARLFIGPGRLGATPYGSYYLEQEKQVMGESTLAVRSFYEDAGLVLDEAFTEMPDHMKVELEFLSYLLQQAISSAARGDEGAYARWVELRKEFLARFVSGWFEAFCDTVRESQAGPFYDALADCLEAVIGRDLALLDLRGFPR